MIGHDDIAFMHYKTEMNQYNLNYTHENIAISKFNNIRFVNTMYTASTIGTNLVVLGHLGKVPFL